MRQNARKRVIGIIINVRVNLTIVASWPAVSLNAKLAATTEEVSFMAVPAHIPKPVSLIPKKWPSGGKMKAAIILNIKIVEIEYATSFSSASMTSAVAAMALPPQIEVPTPMRVQVLPGTFSNLPMKYHCNILWHINISFHKISYIGNC